VLEYKERKKMKELIIGITALSMLFSGNYEVNNNGMVLSRVPKGEIQEVIETYVKDKYNEDVDIKSITDIKYNDEHLGYSIDAGEYEIEILELEDQDYVVLDNKQSKEIEEELSKKFRTYGIQCDSVEADDKLENYYIAYYSGNNIDEIMSELDKYNLKREYKVNGADDLKDAKDILLNRGWNIDLE
jgi:hypothetical protein